MLFALMLNNYWRLLATNADSQGHWGAGMYTWYERHGEYYTFHRTLW